MNKFGKELIEWLKTFVVAFLVVFAISIFILPTTVYGISMAPSLAEKDLLILQRSHTFERGDIVSFKSDLLLSENDIATLNPIQKIIALKNPNKNLIKRVIGLPGDSILIEDAQVFVNGVKLEEPYIGSITTGSIDIKKVPANEYFLMGDNRSHSTDSRSTYVGTVSTDQIMGKVLIRIFPFNKLGNVNSYANE